LGLAFWWVLRSVGKVTAMPNDDHRAGDWITAVAGFWIAPLAIIGTAAVLLALTTGPRWARPLTGYAFKTPVLCAVFFLAFPAVGILISVTAESHGSSIDPASGANGADLVGFFAIGVPFLLLSLWAIWFLIWAFWYCFRSTFRAIDGHPYLASIAAFVTTWAVFVVDQFHPGGTPSATGGRLITLAGTYGGAVTVSALALLEIACLRWSLGFRLRHGTVAVNTTTGQAEQVGGEHQGRV
jgi:hypothetical protein